MRRRPLGPAVEETFKGTAEPSERRCSPGLKLGDRLQALLDYSSRFLCSPFLLANICAKVWINPVNLSKHGRDVRGRRGSGGWGFSGEICVSSHWTATQVKRATATILSHSHPSITLDAICCLYSCVSICVHHPFLARQRLPSGSRQMCLHR